MSETYKGILSNCLDYLNEIYDELVYDTWEEIELDKRCCTQEEKEYLEEVQSKIDAIAPLVDDLRDELWTELQGGEQIDY